MGNHLISVTDPEALRKYVRSLGQHRAAGVDASGAPFLIALGEGLHWDGDRAFQVVRDAPWRDDCYPHDDCQICCHDCEVHGPFDMSGLAYPVTVIVAAH